MVLINDNATMASSTTDINIDYKGSNVEQSFYGESNELRSLEPFPRQEGHPIPLTIHCCDVSLAPTMSNRSTLAIEHIDLIKGSWDKLQHRDENYKETFGSLLEQRITTCTAKSNKFGSKYKAPVSGKKIVERLEGVIALLTPNLRNESLEVIGGEWLDDELDVRLVHKALLSWLPTVLGEKYYRENVAQAWQQTFRDVLLKMVPVY